MKKKVIVGLSGGVDSAVCAYLLKQNPNFLVEAVYMQNWDPLVNNDFTSQTDTIGCQSNKDYEDCLKIVQILDIKLHKINFIKEYWDYVFLDFIRDYKNGITPNPDILCNKFIKFDIFKKYIFEHFKCDYLAMGHYAQISELSDGSVNLIKAKDQTKDQTYFLCGLNQEQLKNVLFPIGNLLKKEVRLIAKQAQLPVWQKRDSTGICFIGERKFINFLENYIHNKPGKIIDIETKQIVGSHRGVFYYTLGQRRNLGISGAKERYFVVNKDLKNNILYVALESKTSKYLVSYQCYIKDFNWINKIPELNSVVYLRYRHLGKLFPCKFIINSDNSVSLLYEQGLFSVNPGQYACLYLDDVCLGGGKIIDVFLDL